MFYLIEHRIAMFFLLLFLYRFTKLKYSTRKTVIIELFSFAVTTAIGLIPGRSGMGNQGLHFVVVDVMVMIVTSYAISVHRDFRPMFIVLCANAYTLIGVVFGAVIYANTESIIIAEAASAIIHIMVFILMQILVRDEIVEHMESYTYRWGWLSFLPLGFQLAIFALTRWPQNINEHPSSIAGVSILMVLMLTTVFILVKLFEEIHRSERMRNQMQTFGSIDQHAVYEPKQPLHFPNGKIQKTGWTMLVLLGILVVSMIGIIINNASRSHRYQKITVEDALAGRIGGVTYQEKMRDGKQDSWDKVIYAGQKEIYRLEGHTYDVTIENKMQFELTDWYLRIDIPQLMYINKAWCGKVEVHQFSDGEELVETFDYNELQIDDLNVKHLIADEDLLVQLNQGDYILYYPNPDVFEVPLRAWNPLSTVVGKTTFGFVLYYPKNVEIKPWQQGYICYKVQSVLTERLDFWIVAALFMAWFVILMFLVGFETKNKSAMATHQKDLKMIQEVMTTLSGGVDAKDTYTAGHSQRVAKYSKMIAEAMKFSEADVLQVFYSAQLHDFGKIGIPEAILNKPAKLSEEEFAIIKSHTTTGYEALKSLSSIPSAAVAARYHHERFDGKGYPDGLKGEEIPLIARIICVADSFDAMNSSRVYRSKMSLEYIQEELAKCSGTQFDPKIAETMIALIDEGKITEKS